MFARVMVFEGERGLLFRQGLFVAELAPGRYTVWTVFGEEIRRVDVRPRVLEVDAAPLWTRDMVPVGIRAAVTVRVTDAAAACVRGGMDRRLPWEAHSALSRALSRRVWFHLAADLVAMEHEALDRMAIETRSYGVSVLDFAVREVRLPRRLRRAVKRSLTDAAVV